MDERVETGDEQADEKLDVGQGAEHVVFPVALAGGEVGDVDRDTPPAPGAGFVYYGCHGGRWYAGVDWAFPEADADRE